MKTTATKHYRHPKGARLTVTGKLVQYNSNGSPLLTYKAGSEPEAEGLALRMGFAEVKPETVQGREAERGTV